MPTLVRILTFLGLAAGTLFAIMAALVFFVEPTTRPVTVEIPIPPRPEAAAPMAPAPVEEVTQTGPFEARAIAPQPVDPGVTGGTLRP